MARLLGERWGLYQESDNRWKPTHLFIVNQTRGRETVGFLESALIALLCEREDWLPYNINVRNGDLGGTGPRKKEWENDKYFVYLALRTGVSL